MRVLTVLLILSIPVISIGIHAATQNTAELADRSFFDSFLSSGFPPASLLCVALVFCLLGLHTSGTALSRAILLMGAISTLGGSLTEALCLGEKLDTIEWLLFANLSIIMVYRLYLTQCTNSFF